MGVSPQSFHGSRDSGKGAPARWPPRGAGTEDPPHRLQVLVFVILLTRVILALKKPESAAPPR